VATGTPQAPDPRHIGPLPDAQAAYAEGTVLEGPALPPQGHLLLGAALGLGLAFALRARARV
jgi:hypothetical protein